MGGEMLLIAVGLAGGLLPLIIGVCQAWPRSTTLAVVSLWLVLSAASGWIIGASRGSAVGRTVSDHRPISVPDDGYVTSEACRSCHPHNYETWHASYHRSMTQVASPQSVVGTFQNVTLSLHGRTYRLERRGDEYWVEMDDSDGTEGGSNPSRVSRRIVLTTGSHHIQIYWFETGKGRKLEQLPFDFRIDTGRWIPDHASFVRPPWPAEEKLPVAGPGQWHLGCIQCHSTHGKPRLETGDDRKIDTHVAEFGIACEACHGPGAEHVRVNRDPVRRYALHLGKEPDSTIVEPTRLPHERSAEVCGQCHAVFTLPTPEDKLYWRDHSFPYRPGDELTRTRHVVRSTDSLELPALREMLKNDPTYRMEDSFWSDGMVRISGREYNGLIESPCYQRGEMTCLSCHVMHKPVDDPRPLREWADDQLKLDMDGDPACLQCHASFASHVSEHTHHVVGSTGSACYNCHMPYTTYGLHKAIRSHKIDSPSVTASLRTGRPNACNQCHLDKTLAWTAGYLSSWYGVAKPEMNEEERTIAASLLWALKGDAGQRAIMAWSFGWAPALAASGSNWIEMYLGHLLSDPYDAVRLIALRTLRQRSEYKDLPHDFTDSLEERNAAVRRAGEIWKQRNGRAGNRSTGDAILIGPDGTPRVDVILRLIQQQDNRPVMLRE